MKEMNRSKKLDILFLLLLINFFILVFYLKFIKADELSTLDFDNDIESRSFVELPNYGSLEGSIGFTDWTSRAILQFLDVPYAESPSGPLRFKPPVPVKPWNGTRDAKQYGTKCPEIENLHEIIKNERENIDVEDCLSMAIFSANLNATLPVMVYIHGGGFYSNNADHYPPNYMMERDIVLVVIQYRLDVLGFLSTGTEEIPGNAGLLDSMQALRFIKENIEYFGGDPNKITVFGQSAGAAIISALLISPSVEDDLFHQAILQSGSIFAGWAYTTEPISDARKIANLIGHDRNQSIESLNSIFMSTEVSSLLRASGIYSTLALLTYKMPYVGKCLTIGGPSNLLPHKPDKIVASGKYKKSMPMIIGIAKDDGSFTTTLAYDVFNALKKFDGKCCIVEELIEFSKHCFDIIDDSGTFTALMSLTFFPDVEFPATNFSAIAIGAIDMAGMLSHKAPVFKFAQLHARNNKNATFLYTFDYKGEHTRFGYEKDTSHYPFLGGTHHSDDLIYLFPDPPEVAKLNTDDTKLAQIMVDLWTSFAINGYPTLPDRPNGPSLTQWPPFIGPYGAYLHIDDNIQIGKDFRDEFTVGTRNTHKQTAID